MLTPTARRELLIRVRSHRLDVARVDERLERSIDMQSAPGQPDKASHSGKLTGDALARWIAARAPSMQIPPEFVSEAHKELVSKEIAAAGARAREGLSVKRPQPRKYVSPPKQKIKPQLKGTGRERFQQTQGYEFLDRACPLCNGRVRISPRMQRTVCLKCDTTLWPPSEDTLPLTNSLGGGPNVTGRCSNCGCPVEEKTKDCPTCYMRHWQWNHGRRSRPW